VLSIVKSSEMCPADYDRAMMRLWERMWQIAGERYPP